jgi:hypothetical protein
MIVVTTVLFAERATTVAIFVSPLLPPTRGRLGQIPQKGTLPFTKVRGHMLERRMHRGQGCLRAHAVVFFTHCRRILASERAAAPSLMLPRFAEIHALFVEDLTKIGENVLYLRRRTNDCLAAKGQ